jgi:hypothetical protein
MIHQQRYFSAMNAVNNSPSQACLRSVVRTLAASLSAPYQRYTEVLYEESRQILEQTRRVINTTDASTAELCYVQAWLLLAQYESLRVSEWQSMMTAGYAFRLVQMMRLHEIDMQRSADLPLSPSFEQTESFSQTEERRRTFWVAYTLDYFLCWRGEWPLTLYEEMAMTRLPTPEANFQNNQPVVMDFLSDALSAKTPEMSSLFSECIILATLHHRCMLIRKTIHDTDIHRERLRHVWNKREPLALAIERRIKLLSQTPTSSPVERDPLLFFIHTLAHSAMICLGLHREIKQGLSWDVMESNYSELGHIYEQRTFEAVNEILRLVKALPSFSCYKAHPFLPNSLSSVISILGAQESLGKDTSSGTEAVKRVLRDLCSVNNIAREICLGHGIVP